MMPQTVPNRPMNGAVAPTEARKIIQRSSRSISRCTVTVIARSTRSRTPMRLMSAPATRADRRHSPIAAPNTAAIGCAGLAPSWSYSSSRLPPDQKRSSNPSASRLTRRRLVHFSNTTAQTQTLAASRPSITSFTTMSACRNRPHSDRSPPAAPRFTASTARSTAEPLLSPALRHVHPGAAPALASRPALHQRVPQRRPPAVRGRRSGLSPPGRTQASLHCQRRRRRRRCPGPPGAAPPTRRPPPAARSPR